MSPAVEKTLFISSKVLSFDIWQMYSLEHCSPAAVAPTAVILELLAFYGAV